MHPQQKKFLLILPVIALPFLCLFFYALGGGTGAQKTPATALGLNPELPKASFDPKKSALDKAAIYEKAIQDSILHQQLQQQEPYAPANPSFKDTKADELLQQLGQLQRSFDQPVQPSASPAMGSAGQRLPFPARRNEPPETDPQLERLNGMLDKVIRIQHPGETSNSAPSSSNNNIEEVIPADSASNSISAIVPEKQVLATGATIALRLEEDVRLGKALIPRGQLVYGLVNINNDRMLIHINSIRNDRNIYTTDLQVFDLDGLPGIHIPGRISRDVTKESADQGLNSLNIMTYDPSLGAQAANAGIQTARSLFSRKVRQIRVKVRAGYQLLLRDAKTANNFHPIELPGEKPGSCLLRPPGFVPGGPFLKNSSLGEMEVGLQGIYMKDEILWFALIAHNASAITYIPEYIRWFIRDRRVFKSTAVQESTLTPLYAPEWTAITGDSSCATWTGFRPFALTRDKELVVEVGEKKGGRVLQLVLQHKYWRKIKKL